MSAGRQCGPEIRRAGDGTDRSGWETLKSEMGECRCRIREIWQGGGSESSWTNRGVIVPRNSRNERGFCRTRRGTSRRDSRAGMAAEVVREVAGDQGTGRRAERRADWFSGICWRGRAWVGG